MPLQWLPLQQRQQQNQQTGRRSPVSEALTPKITGVSGGFPPPRKGFMEEQRELEALEAERKYNEKMMKMQHEQEMEKLKFTAAAKEDAQTQQTTMGSVIAQAQQQGAQKQQIEDNPEPAAQAMYDLIKSMPDETQSVLLNQLFTPSTPSGAITSAGKQVTMPAKYNPIADVFLSKGWATLDEGGRPVLSEPEREFEKTTFKEMTNGDILNTATGEVIANKNDLPKGLTVDEVKEGYIYGMNYMGKLMEPTVIEKIAKEKMETYIEESRAESKLQTEAFLTGILQGKGMSRDKAKAEAKRIAYNMSFEEVSGTTTKPPPTSRGLPLDETMAKDIAAHLLITPDADIEAYRDEYGDATVDRALEINKVPEPTPKPTPKPKPKPEPIVEEEKKVKDYLNKYSPL